MRRLWWRSKTRCCSAAERRAIRNRESKVTARLQDFWGIIPAITGKVELVYEGEQEGPYAVALKLIAEAIKQTFLAIYPDPRKAKGDRDPYGVIRAWFGGGNIANLMSDSSDAAFAEQLSDVGGLRKFATAAKVEGATEALLMEIVLHGLTETEVLNRDLIDRQMSFKDLLAGMLDDEDIFGRN